MNIRSILLPAGLAFLLTSPAMAWTTSFNESRSIEGDNSISVSVKSLSGDSKITFLCSEGMMMGQLDNLAGAKLDGPAALYAEDLQMGADGFDTTIEFANWDQIVKLARIFMRAQGNVDIRYNSRVTRGDILDSFPSSGATKALAPLMSNSMCGLS